MKSQEEQEGFTIWKSVLETIESIEQLNRSGKMSKSDLVDYLNSIQVRLKPNSDPVDNFELFVVYNLSRVIREALESLKT